MCIDSAQQLVSFITDLHDRGVDNMPETWYIVFCASCEWLSEYPSTDTAVVTDAYSCGMVLLVGHLTSASQSSKMRGDDDYNDPQIRSAWIKCLAILRLTQNSSHTAHRCLKLLELSEKKFWTARSTPIDHEMRELQRRAKGADGTNTNLAPLPAQGPEEQALGREQQHFEQYQEHSQSHSGVFDPHMITDGDFDLQDIGQAHNDHLFWMDEPIDIAWLNAAPFEINFEDALYRSCTEHC